MLSLDRQNRFRMKLHPLDREFLVPESHDFVFGGARADFEGGRDSSGIYYRGMITHRVEGIRQVREDRFAIVNHRRGLAMHHPARAAYLRAEPLASTLITPAH